MTTSWKTISSLRTLRVAKYKQRDQLYKSGEIKDKDVSVGACTGLSFYWVKYHHLNPREEPKSRLSHLLPGDNFEGIKAIARRMNSELSMVDYPGKIRDVAVKALGSKDNPITYRLGNTLELSDVNGGAPYGVVYMVLNGNTNHMCAFHSGTDRLTWFDPNFGEFSVPSGNATQFLKSIPDQYKTYVTANGKKAPVDIVRYVVGRVTPT